MEGQSSNSMGQTVVEASLLVVSLHCVASHGGREHSRARMDKEDKIEKLGRLRLADFTIAPFNSRGLTLS